jgi:hypothetical protein
MLKEARRRLQPVTKDENTRGRRSLDSLLGKSFTDGLNGL